ncbi:MAG: phytanoyl-CoA dioxygenase family protein [Gammaproteobacteria bacterium]|nr:phytanoyl-CoA dioxygenase family protein [Gammaproteobacteria bacterium]
MTLTPEQKAHFDEKGFVVAKAFFDQDTMSQISDWLEQLQTDSTNTSKHAAKYYEKSPITGENMLVRVEHILGGNDQEMEALLLSEKTIDALKALLGDVPSLFKEKINYKHPGCRADKLHQDQAAGWGKYSDFFVTLCLAVDPNREDNAALRFMNSGNYQKGLMNGEWTPMSEKTDMSWADDEYDMLEMDPGDVVFFECYVPHGSPANESDKGRRNLYLTFNRASDGDLRARYYADKWEAYPPNDIENPYSADSFRV